MAAPRVGSFREFLLDHARVPVGGGLYGPYTFDGREALAEIVDTIDLVIGAPPSPAALRDRSLVRKAGEDAGAPLKDSTLVIAGGAQFGKTILEQNLAAYLTGCRFLNPGVYLPDDKLADAIVDA